MYMGSKITTTEDSEEQQNSQSPVCICRIMQHMEIFEIEHQNKDQDILFKSNIIP